MKKITLSYATILNIKKLVMVSSWEELESKKLNEVQTVLIKNLLLTIVNNINSEETLGVIEAFENILEETDDETEFQTLTHYLESIEKADQFWDDFKSIIRNKWGYKVV